MAVRNGGSTAAEREAILMKIIKQIGIIFAICWISTVIESLLPFSFPASVLGMLLLFLCLVTGILKIHHIQEKSDFLLSNMAFFFVPAGVSMINYLDVLVKNLIALVVISVISTFITFAATAYSMKLALKLLNRRKQK